MDDLIQLSMKDLKDRLYELNLAIRLTRTYFTVCDTPLLKDLYLQNIEYYKEQVLLVQARLDLLHQNK